MEIFFFLFSKSRPLSRKIRVKIDKHSMRTAIYERSLRTDSNELLITPPKAFFDKQKSQRAKIKCFLESKIKDLL